MTLKERFLELQNEYIQAFAEKQEVDIEYYEKKNEIEIQYICEITINLEDLMFDIDNNIPKGAFFDYYNSETKFNYEKYYRYEWQPRKS